MLDFFAGADHVIAVLSPLPPVDCHKAAYVPVCIAGDQSTMITAEPAVVIPVEFDDDFASMRGTESEVLDPSDRYGASTYNSDQGLQNLR